MHESKAEKENHHGENRRFDLDLLKKGLRCDLDQYEMLIRCSDKKDITEWNQWRKQNPSQDILLEGADLSGVHLKKAYLNSGEFFDEGHTQNFPGQVHLKGVKLIGAHLGRSHLNNACMVDANLSWAHLKGSDIKGTHLQRDKLANAHVETCYFERAHLQGANFEAAVTNGATRFWYCEVDRDTNFHGVPLDSVRIDQGTKQLLEYNIRRKNWEEWYKDHCLLRWPVRWFWCISDYGLRTWRIIVCFFGLALFFAAIYSNLNYWCPPGVVSNLEVEPHLAIWHYFLLLLIRPIYLSIVTMTIGFGNMDANPQSVLGHIMVALQVILGYVLLAALVTRFAVLFKAGGPAGKFADKKEKQDETE